MDVRERIAEFFELPRDSIIDVPRIVIVGCKKLFCQNHLGITEYTSNIVSIGTINGDITIEGKNLIISSINKTEVKVEGEIGHLKLPLESR